MILWQFLICEDISLYIKRVKILLNKKIEREFLKQETIHQKNSDDTKIEQLFSINERFLNTVAILQGKENSK